MIDIAVLTFNRCRISETMLRELHRRTTTPHRTIVVDNGSTDGTPEMLEELVDAGMIDRLVLLDENTGIHWGHNVRLSMVETPLYVATDDDLVPEAPREGSDWLAKLVHLMAERPNLAAVACTPHVMIGDQVNKMLEGKPPVVKRGHIGGHLRLMRTDAVCDVGGWLQVKRPERNNEEKHICGKLRKAGWWVGYARDVRAIVLWGDDDEGEDPWGYPEEMGGAPSHGHRDIWPPVNRFGYERYNVDWETCRPIGK
jgi:glycosyltransferase involved in cell wall biosynthesis